MVSVMSHSVIPPFGTNFWFLSEVGYSFQQDFSLKLLLVVQASTFERYWMNFTLGKLFVNQKVVNFSVMT